jgi:magnesium chelatase subunit D
MFMDYPFAALVEQEQLKTALLLSAVYPAIGGVLIRGEKGTAKSTAARSLAALLPPLRVVEGCPFQCDPAAVWPECPHCSAAAERHAVDSPVPFVDLPLGATEDRVLGTLDFERALREGRRALQPGLLAGAHRGILYIDEVNLLPDHLVDVLLDAAAMGVNTVQREGVSVIHPARFLLVGTMNPEEGELRPQLLDRFGMMVLVAGSRKPEERSEVVRRRLAFEADAAQFAASWAEEQIGLRDRVAAGRAMLPRVVLSDELLTFISQLCCEFEVDGLRPDIALHKTARAQAAFLGRQEVALEDVKVAAELILPHRRKRRPFEQPHLDRKQLDDRFAELERNQKGKDKESSSESSDSPQPGEGNKEQQPHSANSNKDNTAGPRERVFEATVPAPVRRVELALAEGPPKALSGRRNHTPAVERGHITRAVRDENATNLAFGATIRAAVQRGASVDGLPSITPADLHRKECDARTGTLLLFVVDASGSMAARRRMELVKNTVLGLLKNAYEQRDEVAVIAFRGPRAEVLLSPTRSVEQAEHALRDLPTGGRTPLAHALAVAGELVQQLRRSRPGLPILLVLLSDGRANVALPKGDADLFAEMNRVPFLQALEAARELQCAAVAALVLDTNVGFVRLGKVEELARALGAATMSLEDFSAENLILQLRQQRC